MRKPMSKRQQAEYMLTLLGEARKPRAVGDVVQSYNGRATTKIKAIDGDLVTLENGDRLHISKVRSAKE